MAEATPIPMASEMERHKENLNKYCRICFEKTPQKNLRRIPDQVSECLKVLFGVNSNEDSSDVHPSQICNKCRSMFQRYIESVDEVKTQNRPVPKPVTIPPHSHDCEICKLKSGGIKRKRVPPTMVDTTLFKQYKLGSTGQPSTGTESSRLPLLNTAEQPSTSAGTSQETPKHLGSLTSKSQRAYFNINSVPIQQFPIAMHDIAVIFQCAICKNVPLTPVQPSHGSECSHIFCEECFGDLCPRCEEPVECVPVKLQGALASVYKNISVCCKYEGAGCKEHVHLGDLQEHTFSCSFKNKAVPLRRHLVPRPYKSLQKVTVRQAEIRISPIMKEVRRLCDNSGENARDTFFYMLIMYLKKSDDPLKKTVKRLWEEELPRVLTVDECLAMRVCNLQSKSRYREQYDFFKRCDMDILFPPNKVIEHEALYMPGTVRYKLEVLGSGEEFHHTPTKKRGPTVGQEEPEDENTETLQPIDVGDPYEKKTDRVKPNCKGVRWAYADALAKSLEELNVNIEEGLKRNQLDPNDASLTFKVTIKDGADGLGSVSVYKERAEKQLPDNAFRYTFAIIKIAVEAECSLTDVYSPGNPNSVKLNRPLLEAIADENDSGTMRLLMGPIEEERQQLITSTMKVYVRPNMYRKFKFQFFFSMIDEKLDGAEGGLMGSGSKFMCTLCDVSSPKEARTRLGEFSINRTHKEAHEIGMYISDNPDKLTTEDLRALSKGVNSVPVIRADAREKGIDATHADINLASFFYKLLVREVAEVQSWDATEAVKLMISDGASKFDTHMRIHLGVAPSLMMPGSYARQLFSNENSYVVTALIPNQQRQHKMRKVLKKMRAVRKMYRALSPLKDYPEEVATLKETAVEMGRMLLNEFGYASWPNYLHRVIEHCQEFIEDPRGPKTIGGISGEGNEAGNRIFRMIRENISFRGSTEASLTDILKAHWLYSSLKLNKISAVERSQNACSVCFKLGHKKGTCPILKGLPE